VPTRKSKKISSAAFLIEARKIYPIFLARPAKSMTSLASDELDWTPQISMP